jgi:hypothetical protein
MTQALLVAVLREPERLLDLSLADWDRLIRQARSAQLAARLEALCAARGWLDRIPARPRAHLDSARLVCERQNREVFWEVELIRRALAPLGLPVVLLKGAAYVLAALPPANGRLFSDIDIMVPRDGLMAAEGALRLQGWLPQRTDPYDVRYYREWSHELPALHHVRRGSVIDLHHTIMPPTSRTPVDGEMLLATARPLDGRGNLCVLDPTDIVLHSAGHLFQDGDFRHGLRDLLDVSDLLHHFGAEPGFWDELAARAGKLGLGRALYYAVREVRRLFGMRMPSDFLARLEVAAPRPLARWTMGALLPIVLAPDHPTCNGPLTGLARWLIYVRSHYLRMPLRLLVPHLLRKGWRRATPRGSRAAA